MATTLTPAVDLRPVGKCNGRRVLNRENTSEYGFYMRILFVHIVLLIKTRVFKSWESPTHRVAMSGALAARRGREGNYIRNRFSLAEWTNMAAKRIAEEEVYSSILNLFSRKDVDHVEIAKIIVKICYAIEIENENADLKTVVKNAILLILGLLHKDRSMDGFGMDFKSLPDTPKRKIARDLQVIFM